MTDAADDRALRVVLAEDNYLVREGTRRLLEADGGIEVIASVADPAELLDAVARLRPSAVMTDIRMPPTHKLEGIEAARTIRERYPEVGVVVLSQHADDAYVVELLRDGAAGLAYLLKERVADRAQLVHALRETVAGRSVIDPILVDALVNRKSRRTRLDDLTGRELDVLSRMAQGHTNAAIASELHLSRSAVEKHINSIFGKLSLGAEQEVHRRVAAVVAYLRERDSAE